MTYKSSIVFHDETYRIGYKGETVSLLPKEYELFSFFFRHQNQIFSRTDLLLAVWPMSESYPRTVDDHVCRLRKKLMGWPAIQLETVRGRGYRYVLRELPEPANPLSEDSQFQAGMDMMFQRFVQYGQGKGIRSLQEYIDQLQVGLDTRKKLYVFFFTGQFQELLRTSEFPFWERAFYLLYLYSLLQFDARKTLFVYERVLYRKKLPLHYQQEIANFGRLRPLIDSGQSEEAMRQIEQLKKERGISLFLCNAELYLVLTTNLEGVERFITDGELLCEQFPYLREQGRFFLLQALWKDRVGEERAARQNLDKGLKILQTSEIVPSYIHGVRDLLVLSRGGSPLHFFAVRLWNELSERYRFVELQETIEKQFGAHI